MNKPSRYTKIKILVGYVILVFLMFSALYFVQQEIGKISTTDTQETLKTDSLMALLREKDETALQILKGLAYEYDSLIVTTKMERIVPIRKNITQERLQQHEVIIRDSIKNVPKKKTFFKRLAEAFVPPKDTTVITSTRQEISKDTLLKQFQVEDSLYEEIRTINEQRQKRNVAALQRNNSRLMEINQLLTARIDTLIIQYEQQMELQAEQEMQANDEVVERSTEIISKIALIAVILVFIFLLIIWSDINRSNKYRKQIEEANKRSEALLEAREKIMLTITHDFKTPLNSIIGYSQLLLGEVKNKEHREYLNNMKTSGVHLLDLVNNLLDFHKLDLECEEPQYTAFNPAKLFKDIGLSFEPLAADKKLKLEYTVDSALNSAFMGDSQRIRQLTVNLLSNAIKFTDKGKVELEVKHTDDTLSIRVSDSGSGMTPEEKERVFNEFTRLANAQGKEGSGLGLTIVSKLAKLLNADITMDSEVGVGTTFTVTMPLEATEQIIDEPMEEPQKTNQPIALNVIMIDDDPLQLELASTMLKYQGANVVACLTVEELIEKLRVESFDVLMTDVQMPAVNGFDLIKLLRASNISRAHTIPVVAVTGSCDLPEEQYLSSGFYGFLTKPFNTDDLLDAINPNKIAELDRVERMSYQNKLPMEYYARYFVDKLKEDIQKLQQALDEKNAENIVITAHQMLPNLIMVRARQVTPFLAYLDTQRGMPFSKRMAEETQRVLDNVKVVLQAAEKEFSQYL